MVKRHCRYPLDHELYDADGEVVWRATTWAWGQVPKIPPHVELLATRIVTRDALGCVLLRTDLRPVIAA